MAHAKMPLSITIPPRGYQELAVLAAHHEKIYNVVDIAAALDIGVSIEKVSLAVAAATGITGEDAGLMLTGIAALHNLIAEGTVAEPGELLAAIALSLRLESPDEWRKQNLVAFESAQASIAKALSSLPADHPLLMRKKADELTYAHQNIFKSNRIITDLRPVFNAAADEIKAVVLTHVLRIEYYDGVRRQRIEFALDQADVVGLLDSARRAIVKTEATQKAMAGKWELIVAGVNSDADFTV